jgi:hypothetical protein
MDRRVEKGKPGFGAGLIRGNARRAPLSLLGGRLDQDELPHGAFVHKLHRAGDLGKQRVIFAATHIQAGLVAGTPLADDDGTARDKLTAENLHSQPLRVGIAAIT